MSELVTGVQTCALPICYGVHIDVEADGEQEGARMAVEASGGPPAHAPRFEPAVIEDDPEIEEDILDEDEAEAEAEEDAHADEQDEDRGDRKRRRRRCGRRGRGRDDQDPSSETADVEASEQAEDDHDEADDAADRSEEHTSELQSLMRISYAVFCLKKKNNTKTHRK